MLNNKALEDQRLGRRKQQQQPTIYRNNHEKYKKQIDWRRNKVRELFARG
jgi:hypothetical protein